MPDQDMSLLDISFSTQVWLPFARGQLNESILELYPVQPLAYSSLDNRLLPQRFIDRTMIATYRVHVDPMETTPDVWTVACERLLKGQFPTPVGTTISVLQPFSSVRTGLLSWMLLT